MPILLWARKFEGLTSITFLKEAIACSNLPWDEYMLPTLYKGKPFFGSSSKDSI